MASDPLPSDGAGEAGDADRSMRIGEVARAVGTTPRTIRYYEELGLLGPDPGRESGKHREYSERDVDRLRELIRLKQLLGVSLEELKELAEAEEARSALRQEWHHGHPDAARQRQILVQALAHIDRQLELVRARASEIAKLDASLSERREGLAERLSEHVSRR